MTIVKSIRIALVSVLALFTAMEAGSVVMAQGPVINTAAVQTLQKMTDFTKNLREFSVNTQVTLEDVLDSGQSVDFDVFTRVAVRRPDKIRAERIGEQLSQVFYYDGKTLTLWDPVEGVYATQPAPGTIEELIDYTREVLGLIIPVSDLVYRNSFAILMEDVQSATVVGETTIGGVKCTHLAFRRPGVDFQVWVATGDQPFPCKYVVTDTSTPEMLSTVTVMSDWVFNPEADDATFSFVPPEGAIPVPFVPLDNGLDH